MRRLGPSRERFHRFGMACSIYLAIGLIGLLRFQGPWTVPRQSPESVASGERGLDEIRNLLGEQPTIHSAGSRENAEVRQRLSVRLQQLGMQLSEHPFDSKSGQLVNLLAVHPGVATQRPILVVSHYDSCRFGPGAGDALSCVGAMLECIRTLQSRKEWRNEVLFLFTDGEESGLLGAIAFVKEFQDRFRVAPLVINFDARGSSHAAVMYETNRNNFGVVKSLGPHFGQPAFSNSLMSNVYERLPNKTDYTIFKKADWPGVNFALVGGAHRYHTPEDLPENLSPRSVQSFADHLLSLLTVLETWTPEQWQQLDSPQDAVFFDLLGGPFVVYPVNWNIGLSLTLWLLLFAAWWRCNQRFRIRFETVGLLLTMVVPAIVLCAIVGMLLARGIRAVEIIDRPFVAGGEILSLIYVLIASAIVLALGGFASRRFHPMHARFALLTIWTLLATLASIGIPGGAFLFHWPGIMLALLLLSAESSRTLDYCVVALSALLYAPLTVLFLFALGPSGGTILTTIAAVFLLPLLPLLMNDPKSHLSIEEDDDLLGRVRA